LVRSARASMAATGASAFGPARAARVRFAGRGGNTLSLDLLVAHFQSARSADRDRRACGVGLGRRSVRPPAFVLAWPSVGAQCLRLGLRRLGGSRRRRALGTAHERAAANEYEERDPIAVHRRPPPLGRVLQLCWSALSTTCRNVSCRVSGQAAQQRERIEGDRDGAVTRLCRPAARSTTNSAGASEPHRAQHVREVVGPDLLLRRRCEPVPFLVLREDRGERRP
ncbi:MAG: hypothetical protein JWO86_5231, partial [Myxococcaceae bacterium]|nr:hypothetical protein [Myxococcaceae bacterium]